ncbi:agmatinase [Oharaeibacter diazotrophicus]|uniref:Agmatinase n=1 Tax=Oharaeibacter diazotrophicus TaxID=1920512 RepID=A0A4R6RA33_9HYPH|nr:agmatinase [Oharaeibacter diazotrophicus]TDP82496.1 agmatinase [Oharaeibacter diazotrophicus]BBE72740.1 guanidinobutyrase [Pleomorphomonas sp. SM30]GLS76776.1 agmatinase [Oharaeibacter diazotrophicus]
MSGIPTFAVPPTFLGVTNTSRDADYVVAGIPLDVGVTNRTGARSGPAAVRAASRMLTDGAHPHFWVEPAAMPVADVGDFAIALGDIAKSLALIEAQAEGLKHLLAIGGEHGVSLALLRALRKRVGAPLAMVHFDAHVDTWPDNFGQVYGHGSPFFHAIEEGLIDPARTIQIGIRSPVQREVWDWTVGKGVTILSAQDVHEIGPAAVAERVRAVVGTAPAYFTYDVDCLDPAFAPGTGTPEFAGLLPWQVQAIIRRLGGLDFVGMDVVEVAPAYDVAEITALSAATVVWEYLALLGSR